MDGWQVALAAVRAQHPNGSMTGDVVDGVTTTTGAVDSAVQHQEQDLQPEEVAQPTATLRRQVTFGVASVQTEEPAAVDDGASDFAAQMAALSNIPAEPRSRLRRLFCADGTACCYFCIAILMLCVGVTIVAITVKEKWFGGEITESKSASAQLWIVGPIFLCTGVLVCIKLATHLYKHYRPRAIQDSLTDGNFLAPDQRASLAALPPSYSAALNARVPSAVIVEEDETLKSGEHDNQGLEDNDSYRLVTINVDPPPPSYGEAIETLAKAGRLPPTTQDVGVQACSKDFLCSEVVAGDRPPSAASSSNLSERARTHSATSAVFRLSDPDRSTQLHRSTTVPDTDARYCRLIKQ